MSESSESILDHIAEMLRFISITQSFLFSLDTRYGHGCHLANRFCLEPDDYEVLLVVAGLAHYTRFGFAMKPTACGDCGGSGNSNGDGGGGEGSGGGSGGDGGGRESDDSVLQGR